MRRGRAGASGPEPRALVVDGETEPERHGHTSRMRLLLPCLVVSALALPACSCESPAVPVDAGTDTRAVDGGAVDAAIADAGGMDGGGVDVGSTDGGTDLADASDATSTDAPFDAGPPCETPLTWIADTTSEGPATAAALAFSSTAMPTWNDARGTFESIYQINVVLACPDGTELWDALTPVIDAHADIFQIDRSEWGTPSSFPCSAVSTSLDFARLDRRDFGPGTVAHDFVSFAVRRVTGGVELRSFIGNYTPKVPVGVAAEMARCGGLALETARANVLRETFSYSTFSLCVPTGSGTYTPGPLDVLTLEPPRWSWTERLDGTGIELTSEQPGTLVIHPSYVTPSMEASDLNCPNEAGDARVYGYRLLFDAATGAILSALPGVGCIVC